MTSIFLPNGFFVSFFCSSMFLNAIVEPVDTVGASVVGISDNHESAFRSRRNRPDDVVSAPYLWWRMTPRTRVHSDAPRSLCFKIQLSYSTARTIPALLPRVGTYVPTWLLLTWPFLMYPHMIHFRLTLGKLIYVCERILRIPLSIHMRCSSQPHSNHKIVHNFPFQSNLQYFRFVCVLLTHR